MLIADDDLMQSTILGKILTSIDPTVSYTWMTSAEAALKVLAEG